MCAYITMCMHVIVWGKDGPERRGKEWKRMIETT